MMTRFATALFPTLLVLGHCPPSSAQTSVAATVEVCRYGDGFTTLPSSACDPRDQWSALSTDGRSFEARLGYAYAPDATASALPTGTTLACLHFSPGYGGRLSTNCGAAPPPFEDSGPVANIFTATDSLPAGRVPICEYRNSESGVYLTTTDLTNQHCTSLPSGFEFVRIVGSLYDPRNPPPDVEIASLRVKKNSVQPKATLYRSTLTLAGHERRLYAQVFSSYPGELTPMVVKLTPSGERTYLFPGSSMFRCASPDNLFDRAIFFEHPTQQCNHYLEMTMEDPPGPNGELHFHTPPPGQDWKTSYNTFLSVHLLPVPPAIPVKLVGIVHGQDQNMKYFPDQQLFYSHVKTEQPSAFCGETSLGYPCLVQEDPLSPVFHNYCLSGFLASDFCPGETMKSGWHEGWFFKSVFLSKASVSIAALTSPGSTATLMDAGPLSETGPIAWVNQGTWNLPSLYSDSWSVGPYFGSAVVRNNRMFLFFINSRPPTGTYQCMAAAQATISKPGYEIGDFVAYNGHGGYSGPKLLPPRYSLDHMASFYDIYGGSAQCLFPNTSSPGDQYESMSFRVARVAGKNLWISVEERFHHTPSGPMNQLVLRLSNHPGKRWEKASEVILDEVPGGWGVRKLTDARFFDSTGTTNEQVDPNDFWIVGNRRSGDTGDLEQLYAVRLRLSFP